MRWPFGCVHCAAMGQLAKEANDSSKAMLGQNTALLTLLQDVLGKYHALKVQGAATPEPHPMLDRKAPDPVLEAITAKAGSDRRLRAFMSREAMAARAMQIPDSEIIQQIEQGVALDEGIPA